MVLPSPDKVLMATELVLDDQGELVEVNRVHGENEVGQLLHRTQAFDCLSTRLYTLGSSSCIATSKSNSDTMLPDPLGLLLKTVPAFEDSTVISHSATVEVWHMFEAQEATLPTKRGVYARFIPEEKAEVGKRTAP